MMNTARPSSRWLLAHTLAIAFSLGHTILDWWLGVLGSATDAISSGEIATLIVSAGLYAVWANALTLAGQGRRSGQLATIGLAAIASLNGFSIVFCLPPCAFPVGDLSHIGSLVFCLWAIFESWRALKLRAGAYARHVERAKS